MDSVSRPPRRANVPAYQPPFGQPTRPAPRPLPKPEPCIVPPKPGIPRPSVNQGHTCRLALAIDGTDYTVRIHGREPGEDNCGPVVRLRKADGTLYDVAKEWGLWECTCGDFVFRLQDKPGALDGCKHIKALRACGLIGLVAPTPAPRKPETLAIPRGRNRAFGEGLTDAEGVTVDPDHDRWSIVAEAV